MAPISDGSHDWSIWGKRVVRVERERRGLTRTQLAALADLAESTIRNLETGRNVPDRATVTRISAALDLPVPTIGSVLFIAIAGLSLGTVEVVLVTALDEFLAPRRNVADFVSRTWPQAEWEELPRLEASVQVQVDTAQTLRQRIAAPKSAS